MAKQSKDSLQAALQSRSPLIQRQAITPVNILEEATLTPKASPLEETERKKSTEQSNVSTERKKRTEKASRKTVRRERTFLPNEKNERKKRVILAEPEKPETVRDSYEAYVEQLETIEILQALYRKKTGRPLTKSRIIREALEYFLPQALGAYKDDKNYEVVQQSQERPDIEERFRTDTEVHQFKKWLRSHDQPQDSDFAQRFLADGRLPQHASRGMYEAKMRTAGYSEEDMHLFQNAWKTMLFTQS
jgi:hypothetical protein